MQSFALVYIQIFVNCVGIVILHNAEILICMRLCSLSSFVDIVSSLLANLNYLSAC